MSNKLYDKQNITGTKVGAYFRHNKFLHNALVHQYCCDFELLLNQLDYYHAFIEEQFIFNIANSTFESIDEEFAEVCIREELSVLGIQSLTDEFSLVVSLKEELPNSSKKILEILDNIYDEVKRLYERSNNQNLFFLNGSYNEPPFFDYKKYDALYSYTSNHLSMDYIEGAVIRYYLERKQELEEKNEIETQEQLEQYVIKDNFVYIPTEGTQYRRLNYFATRNHCTINEYIERLGYVRSYDRKAFLDRFLVSADQKDVVMARADISIRTWSDVYKKYPLIGDFITTTEKIEDLYVRAHKIVDKAFLSGNCDGLAIIEKELVCLAIINYAKTWESDNGSQLFNYIATCFGYRNDNKFALIAKSCVFDALTSNSRWVNVDEQGNIYYKSTILAHSFSPRSAWKSFILFLNDFYVNNLHRHYYKGDPLISRLSSVLNQKIAGCSENEYYELDINDKKYSFSLELKQLLSLHPQFMTDLIDQILSRISWHTSLREYLPNSYIDILVDECLDNYDNHSLIESEVQQSLKSLPASPSYSKIKVAYTHTEDGQIVLKIPEIRLTAYHVDKCYYRLFIDESLLTESGLAFYGNELGYSIASKDIVLSLPTYIKLDNAFNIRIQIYCNESVIYDSEKSLYRKYLLFESTHESRLSRLTGDDCLLFVPEGCHFSYKNTVVDIINQCKKQYACYYMEFSSNSIVSVADDYSGKEQKKAKISIHLNRDKNAVFLFEGEDYQVCDYEDILITKQAGNEEIQFLLDGVPILNQFIDSKDEVEYCISKLAYGCNIPHTIQVVEDNTHKPIASLSFISMPSLDYYFDKPFYFSEEDYSDSHIVVLNGSKVLARETFSKNDEEVMVSYLFGDICINIPRVHVSSSDNRLLNKELIWYRNIKQDTFLQIVAPMNCKVNLIIGENIVESESKNRYGLGNAVIALDQNIKADRNVAMTIISPEGAAHSYIKTYDLFKVALKDRFVSPPKLYLNDGVLSWDGGGNYVGLNNSCFLLDLDVDKSTTLHFSLTQGITTIANGINLADGEYEYRIFKKSTNLFNLNDQYLCKGALIVGDSNAARFNNYTLIVDTLAFENENGDIGGRRKINPVYIDHITYEGINYVPAEGRECPIYKGTMYELDHFGNRRDYSTDDRISKNGKQYIAINPVTIIYLGGSTLSITDPWDDGLYYYYYIDKSTGERVYQIAMYEYNQFTQNRYGIGDLYSFKKERK